MGGGLQQFFGEAQPKSANSDKSENCCMSSVFSGCKTLTPMEDPNLNP